MWFYFLFLFFYINSYGVNTFHVYSNFGDGFFNVLKYHLDDMNIVWYRDKVLFKNLNRKKLYICYKSLPSVKRVIKGAKGDEVYNMQVDIYSAKKSIYSKQFSNVNKDSIIKDIVLNIKKKLKHKSTNGANKTYVKKLVVSSHLKDNICDIKVKDFENKKETLIKGIKYLNHLNIYGNDLIYVANNNLKYCALNGSKENMILKKISLKFRDKLFFHPKVSGKYLLTTMVDKSDFSSKIVKFNLDNGDMNTLATSNKIFLNPIQGDKNSIFFQMLDKGNLNVYKINLSNNKIIRISRGKCQNINMSMSPNKKKLAIVQQSNNSRIMSILDIVTGKISRVFKSSNLATDVHFFANNEIAFRDKGRKTIFSYNCRQQKIKKVFTGDRIASFYIQ
ncbi:MAG: hypothetical protein AAFO15_01065 [Pseudomonadota bacterium]